MTDQKSFVTSGFRVTPKIQFPESIFWKLTLLILPGSSSFVNLSKVLKMEKTYFFYFTSFPFP